jgi:hypothetical protein
MQLLQMATASGHQLARLEEHVSRSPCGTRTQRARSSATPSGCASVSSRAGDIVLETKPSGHHAMILSTRFVTPCALRPNATLGTSEREPKFPTSRTYLASRPSRLSTVRTRTRPQGHYCTTPSRIRRQHSRRSTSVSGIELRTSSPDARTLTPNQSHRGEAYIAHILSASPSVQLVSAADKLHNARAILCDYRDVGERLWERFNGGRDGTLWYYRELTEAFRKNGSPLSGELD